METNKKDIISKIKEKAYDNVNKKLEEEKQKTEEKINSELDRVEEVLKYINNKLIFKEKGDSWNCNYVLVTEEMFFDDYSKEGKYSWENGIKIKHKRERKYDPFILVNGESYYDIRYLIRNYEETFNNYNTRLQNLRDNFREIERKVEELKKKEPLIKRLIEEYQKVEIEEEI